MQTFAYNPLGLIKRYSFPSAKRFIRPFLFTLSEKSI